MVTSMTIMSRVTKQQMEWLASFGDLDHVGRVLVDRGYLLQDKGLLYPARAAQLLDKSLGPMPLRVHLLHWLGGLSGMAGYVPKVVWEEGRKWMLYLLACGAVGLVAWGKEGLEKGKELWRWLLAAECGGVTDHQEDKEEERWIERPN